MKQQCFLWSIWLTWLSLPVLAAVGFFLFGWGGAITIAVVGVVAQIVYIRLFPRLSQSMGYGPVDDVPAGDGNGASGEELEVTLYTASACPFCPLIRTRLTALQQRLHFRLKEIDVTFRPDVITAKGLRSVPAVEARGHLHVGDATSAELLALLTAAS